MSNTFQVGTTYKLSDKALAFISMAMQTKFAGEDGVFKVEEVTDFAAFSDDVTSPQTPDRFSIPHFMREDCTEVVNG